MQILYKLLVVVAFFIVLFGVIAYARGYRLDLEKKSVTTTGILAVSSSPKAAKIYVNGELKGVTDTSLIFPPGQYQVKIKKEGYTTWSKNIKLKGELVVSLDALLFPTNPSLSPLTNLGITKAVPIDQTEKVILFSENENPEKDGVYLFEVNKKPLSFLPPLKLIVLKSLFPKDIAFQDIEVDLSPDAKQAIFSIKTPDGVGTNSYLISLEEENKNLFEVTSSKETFLETWEKEKQELNRKILETYPKEFAKIATDSFKVISFSPDETKFLYSSKKKLELPQILKPPMLSANQTPEKRSLDQDGLYIYDRKEDKNYEITIKDQLLWYPDSKHLISIDYPEEKTGKEKITVIDYDSNNNQTVYSGPFEGYFFTTTSDGKVIILSNLNPEANKLPDLYLVGIR